MSERIIDSFEATRTDNGERVRVNIVEQYTEVTTALSHAPQLVASPLKVLCTEDWIPVKRISRGRYEVLGVFGDFEITSSEPNAV